MKRTITIQEVRKMNISTFSKKDDSPRGCKTVSTADLKVGDKIVIDNYFTEIIDSSDTLTIKVNKKDDTIHTKINGTLEEIAQHYFTDPEVESINILEGGETETDLIKQIPILIYRTSEQDIKDFQLIYNIRYQYAVMLKSTGECELSTAGLCII